MLELKFIPYSEFKRIQSLSIDEFKKLSLIADMCRANTLMSVKKAGSGHLGSSFSAMDIAIFLYYHEMNTIQLGFEHPDRDIYFSSKGHDVPGLYSVLNSLKIISDEKLFNLRQLGGLDGHPDINIQGIEANSGSLGMGISKAKGMAYAKSFKGNKGRVFVLTGDGELQEGQIWESLQTTASQQINNVTMIVDFNKIQTDKSIHSIISLGNLENKFKTFGWHVESCDGHNFNSLQYAFKKIRDIQNKPKVLIADTIKGKGISFMEGSSSIIDGKSLYQWHSGAPDDESFETGYTEIIDRINSVLLDFTEKPLDLEVIGTQAKGRVKLKDAAEKVVTAYGEAIVELKKQREDLVVLDADLSADCGLRPFENSFPDAFIENGIAEQDMVSMAGGLALQGLLPIVNTFGVFLASRANEQIYNNATEHTKIIYVCHYAGLIPAGPGKSHQSLRDISLFGALPNMIIIEPCNAVETKAATNWCVMNATENCMMRLVISPSPRTIMLPEDYQLEFGKGTIIKDGKDAVMFAYGPVLLHEALLASEILEKEGISLKIVNIPWLNRIDEQWFKETIGPLNKLFVLDNHSPIGGLGTSLLKAMSQWGNTKEINFYNFAVEGFPACGMPKDALRHHKLDGESIAERVKIILKKN